jgi:L-threonylcarbamoyladenylate synthase
VSSTRLLRIEDDGSDAREELERCVRSGGVAVFPADTVYGVACDPLNEEAIERINALKDRDPSKPSAVMFFDRSAMRELLSTLGPRTRVALDALLPGPVTLVVRNPRRLYPLACREDPERIGVRLIAGPLVGAGCAVFQTSANRSGERDARCLEDVDPEILAGVELAIDGGELFGRPSTVIDLTTLDDRGTWTVLREGALPRAKLERALADLGHP